MTTRSLNFVDAWLEKYRFRKLLGHGAFATVWLADECNPNREVIRPVAIKVFVDDLADRVSFQSTFENFQLDLRFLADLAPDNPIIQYYNSEVTDIFVDNQGIVATINSRNSIQTNSEAALTAFLIIMEYADGGSVGPTYREEVIVQRQDNLYLDHFIDICAGLRSAHAREIIHRDIKPRNLMWFKKFNRVKIGDFGIAKHLNEIKSPGLYVTGTPAYMAPESFDIGSRATPQRDVYALGCTFYEILTGEQAFNLVQGQGDPNTLIDSFRRLHEHEPRPDAVIKVPNLVSVELSSLIKSMMSRDPQERPKLNEIIEALKREKKAPVDIQNVSRVKIPENPKHLSTYSVNPVFRHEQLKESVFFVFITMSTQGTHKYKMLFALLDAFFGNTYSICELFGRYDFLVRVWSTRANVLPFCEKLIDELLDNNKNALQIMAIDEVTYVGTPLHVDQRNLSVAQVLVKLNEAQAGKERTARDAAKWLQRNRIYVRKLAIDGKNSIHCHCLVSQSESASQEEREAKGALIIRALEQVVPEARKLNLSVYRKAYQLVERLNNEHSDYVISYLSPSFDGVSRITSVILDHLNAQRLRVVTLLASGRYFVESDNVHTQPQRVVIAP